MDISPIQMLCAAVVERAVDDCRLLNEKGKEFIENKDEGDFSREEIESFFRSDFYDISRCSSVFAEPEIRDCINQ